MEPSGAARAARVMAPRTGAWGVLRARRGVRIVAVALLAMAGAACATKRDVRDLREQIAAMQARQDSLLRVLVQQNRALMDSVRQTHEMVLRVRGELGNQLVQVEQQLIQIQELTGQSQQQLAILRQQVSSRGEYFAAPPEGAGRDAGAPSGSGTEPEQLYRVGLEQLQRGNARVARQAFETIVKDHPTHQRAPEAQLQVAETYYQERNYDGALQALDRVVELFPNSPAARRAVYRAGVIAEEQGNLQRARSYFQRVVSGWPGSEEAELARDKLRRMSNR